MLHSHGVEPFLKVQRLNWDLTAREQIREWLQSILDERGLSPIELAQLVGVSPTTIYRAMDVKSEFLTSTKTLQKISTKTGRLPPGPGYLEAHHIEPAAYSSGIERIDLPKNIVALTPEEHRRFACRVLDRSLELEGYLPGDIVVVDEGIAPKAGDIVYADVAGTKNSGPVLRLFEPPYLISRSLDRRIEPAPILLDRSVEIRGTATAMFREMRKAS